jgi:hypothetical protein
LNIKEIGKTCYWKNKIVEDGVKNYWKEKKRPVLTVKLPKSMRNGLLNPPPLDNFVRFSCL